MRHEKIIKREDGTQYKIGVSAYIDPYNDGKITYRVSVCFRLKGKRKWSILPDALYDYEYRGLSMEDREKHRKSNQLRFVTAEEIHQAKIELWELLKPNK